MLCTSDTDIQPGRASLRFTFRTSCLHFSILSCSFFSCSGLRDGSALLLASREMASFSSLHAVWWAFFAASTYRRVRSQCSGLQVQTFRLTQAEELQTNVCFIPGTTGKASHSINIYPHMVLGIEDIGQPSTHDLICGFELGGQMQA